MADHFGMTAKSLAAIVAATNNGIQILIPEEGELAKGVEATLNQSANERKIGLSTAVPDFAIFIEIQDSDASQLRGVESFVQIACHSFQVGPLLPKALDPSRVEIDANKTVGCQCAFSFQHFEREQASRAHQLAPVAQ